MCGAARTVISTRINTGTNQEEEVVESRCVPSPVVHFQGQEDIICRRGLPEPFTTPWDRERREEGDGTDSAPQQDERRNSIFLSVSNYWFKVFPVIRNRSKYYLVITDVNFKARSSVARGQIQDKPFRSGYCETTPYLYILNPGTSEGNESVCARNDADREKNIPECHEGSFTSYGQFERSYVMGNLAFYVDGLTAPPQEANNRFTPLRIPNYSVNWEILGIFYTENGNQVGNFQKRGIFRTQRSSF